MHIDRRFLNWGVFLILLGGIPLLVRQGVVSEDNVARLWTLWPLLLVAAGVGILLSRTAFDFVGGLLAAATFGLIGGSILASGFGVVPFAGCGDQRGTVPFAAQEGQLTGPASVVLELNCGDLTAGTTAGSTWRVEGRDADGRGPTVDAASTSVAVRSRARGAPFDFLGSRDQWTVTLPQGVELALNMTVNAGAGTVDLAGARLSTVAAHLNAGDLRLDLANATASSFDVEVNAGSAKVALPASNASGSLSVNAGSIAFCTAPGTGLRIRTNDNLTASNNFAAQGLTRSNGVWETPGYDSAQVRIEIDAEANAGGFTLNPTGGCNG